MTITDDVETIKYRLLQTKLDNPYDLTTLFYLLRTYREVMMPFLTETEVERLQQQENDAKKHICLHKQHKRSNAMNTISTFETSLRIISEREIKNRTTNRTEIKNG